MAEPSAPTRALRAEIISIGEELLSGDPELVDTNAIYITKMLRERGLNVIYKTTVGDNLGRIAEVFRLALDRVDVIIATGGLGPTVDDMTRQGIADAINVPLEFRQELMDGIAEKFARFGVRMTDNNRVQANIPQGAIALDNQVGTAPGFAVEYQKKMIYSLPGVPREMRYLMENAVLPHLRVYYGITGVLKTRVLRTAGIGESMLDDKIGEFEKMENPVVGLAAHAGQVDIRIMARGATGEEADALIAQTEAAIRERVGQHIYGVEKEKLAQVFAATLQSMGTRVALLEIGTNGLLRRRIESQPGGVDILRMAESSDLPLPLGDLSPVDNASNKYHVEEAAKALQAKTGMGLAIVAVSGESSTAVGISNGSETIGRAYAYHTVDIASAPDWAASWGMGMAWSLLNRMNLQKPSTATQRGSKRETER